MLLCPAPQLRKLTASPPHAVIVTALKTWVSQDPSRVRFYARERPEVLDVLGISTGNAGAPVEDDVEMRPAPDQAR